MEINFCGNKFTLKENYKITLQAHILDIEPHKCTGMVLTKTLLPKKFKPQTKCTGPRAMIGGKRKLPDIKLIQTSQKNCQASVTNPQLEIVYNCDLVS